METRNINGDELTLEEAFVKNNRLIWSIVKRYYQKGLSLGLEPDDLHSLASIGFIKAFNNFDPVTYHVKFSTYAVPKMIGEMQRYFRDQAGDLKFSRRIIELGNKIYRDGLEEEKINVIALHFDVKEFEVEEAFTFMRHNKATSLEKTVYEKDGDSITLADSVGNNKLADFTEANVNVFLDSLKPRDRLIIESVMQEKTQSEIGRELGITQVQVSRLLRNLYPLVETFFGYPIGYFSNRPTLNQGKEMVQMNQNKKKQKRSAKGDLELAKQLLTETKRTPCSIAKETGCGDPSVYYWAKKIRNPQASENPVTISKLEPLPENKVEEKHLNNLKEDLVAIRETPPTIITEPHEYNSVELGVPKVKYREELLVAEEAVKLAEEHRTNLLKNASIGFGYHIASNEVTPADLHILFTQAGHTAAASGLESVNINIVISTEKISV